VSTHSTQFPSPITSASTTSDHSPSFSSSQINPSESSTSVTTSSAGCAEILLPDTLCLNGTVIATNPQPVVVHVSITTPTIVYGALIVGAEGSVVIENPLTINGTLA